MKRALLMLGLAAALSGCTHLTPKKPTGLMPGAVVRDQASREAMTRLIAGKVGLHIEGKDRSVSGRGRLVSEAPRHFRLELRDPLGRVQYVLVLDGDRLVAFYPRQKLAYVDAQAGRNYVRRFMGLDFSLPELRNLFLGILPAPWHGKTLEGWHWDEGQGAYVGHLKAGNAALECAVDPDTAAITQLEWRTPTARVIARFSDFTTIQGERSGMAMALPKVVRVELEEPASAVEIEWHDFERLTQPKPPSLFELSLPADVKREPL